MGMIDDRGSSLGPYNLSEETIRLAQRIAQQTTHSTAEVIEEISARLARGNDYPWLAGTTDRMSDLRKDIVDRSGVGRDGDARKHGNNHGDCENHAKNFFHKTFSFSLI